VRPRMPGWQDIVAAATFVNSREEIVADDDAAE
jgi:hypothetical protein